MVGNDSERSGGLLGFSVNRAAYFRYALDDLRKQIRIVHAAYFLKNAYNTLKAHAGVHIFLVKRLEGAVGGFVVLHEHIVPYLKILAA